MVTAQPGNQRICPPMEGEGVFQPTLALSPPSPVLAGPRAVHSSDSSILLAPGPLVAATPGATNFSDDTSNRTTVHRTEGGPPPTPPLAHSVPSHPGEGDACRALRDLPLFTNIPALQRQRMIKAIDDTYPSPLDEASNVRARLKLQGNGPK